MTDINARIAKAKGLPETRYDKHGFVEVYCETPQYTTDWRLAGELLEEMKNNLDGIEYQESNKRWRIDFFLNYISRYVFGDTLPLAVALAYLDWSEK